MSHPDSTHAQETKQRNGNQASATFALPYRSLLLPPTVLLAGNPVDRHDVETAAILGYN
ncbi:hypothetical protein [Paraburkholderia mimosarum]|uniref:hypothetical protein n=1 Tax=Paraburkholderia mimosarum TaxID=312026 RepID=UPI00041D3F17|nr:hypothetical protein [Paraburkholderia mimosarum]